MKIKINGVEVPEAMLDVAARVSGFSDGLRVAIGVHQKGSSADPFPFRSGTLGEYRLQDRAKFAGGRECVRR